MGIFFDSDPETGDVRFYHEAVLGMRKIPAEQTAAEIEAGKRPKLVDNPACRIPAEAKPISDAAFKKLFDAQAEGKQIAMRGKKPLTISRTPDPIEQRAIRRATRDRLLAASDWTQLSDSPLPAAEQDIWRDYRQALRDLDMGADDWPAEPIVGSVGGGS